MRGNVSAMGNVFAGGDVSAMETVQGDPGTGAGMTIAGGNVSAEGFVPLRHPDAEGGRIQ